MREGLRCVFVAIGRLLVCYEDFACQCQTPLDKDYKGWPSIGEKFTAEIGTPVEVAHLDAATRYRESLFCLLLGWFQSPRIKVRLC